jgi:UDP-glucose 6-dehydrogenase
MTLVTHAFMMAQALDDDKCLHSGSYFASSFFHMDIPNIMNFCRHYEMAANWERRVWLNHWQHRRISRLLRDKLYVAVSSKLISKLKFSFISDTNNTHKSPAIHICSDLLEKGKTLQIVEPMVNMGPIALGITLLTGAGESSWQEVPNVLQATRGTDVHLMLTDGVCLLRSAGPRWHP